MTTHFSPKAPSPRRPKHIHPRLRRPALMVLDGNRVVAAFDALGRVIWAEGRK